MTIVHKKIQELKTEDYKNSILKISFDEPSKISTEQWKIILHHWHDSTEYEYQNSTKFLTDLGINTNGIAGGKYAKNVKQFLMAIHSHHDVNKYKDFYLMVKDALISYQSMKDNSEVITISLLINMFNQDWLNYGHQLEIRKKDDKCRFIDTYSSLNNPSKWMSIDKAFEEIEKYKNVEIEYENCY